MGHSNRCSHKPSKGLPKPTHVTVHSFIHSLNANEAPSIHKAHFTLKALGSHRGRRHFKHFAKMQEHMLGVNRGEF